MRKLGECLQFILNTVLSHFSLGALRGRRLDEVMNFDSHLQTEGQVSEPHLLHPCARGKAASEPACFLHRVLRRADGSTTPSKLNHSFIRIIYFIFLKILFIYS